MKKNLQMLGMCLFGSLALNAQTVITSENFEATAAGAIPTGWTQTFQTGSNGWTVGDANSLSSQYFTYDAHTKFLGTNDDDCNCDKSNDFIKTPSVDLSSYTTVALKFDLFFYEGSYNGAQESLKLEVSTNGGTSWTVVDQLTGVPTWSTYLKDVSAYAGPGNTNVMFALRYNDGGDWTFGAGMDDYSLFVPLSRDIAVTSVVLPTFAANGGNVTVSGDLVNYGADPVTSMTLNYSVDNGAPVTQNLSGLNIAAINGNYSYSHNIPWVAGPVGSHTIKVWATNINGGADQNTANDEAQSTIIVASQLVTRVTCIEEFSSSTCPPCASFNATFDPLLESNNVNNINGPGSSVSAIKYQMNWPSPGTDPSYNPDGATRRTYYGVNGIPSPWIDGRPMNSGDQAEIDDAASKQAPAALSCTYSVNGGFVGVNVSVTPYISIPSGTKLYIAVNEKEYTFTGGTTSQTEYHHAMRKMLPNGSGISVNNMVDGVAQNFSQSYNFSTAAAGATPSQNSYTLWIGPANLEVVAFLQNDATGEIYQSAIGTKVTGVEDAENAFGVQLFPNPANEMVVVSLNMKESSVVNVELVNNLGQVVFASNEGMVSGSKNLRINTSEIPAGVYFARIAAGENTQTFKFTVSH